jgi:Mce-associated membrane protein
MMTTRSAVGRRAVLGRALVVLVAAGLIACCWQSWRWWDATRSDNAVAASIAAARDAAATAGRDGMVTFNTMDYRQVDASLDRWAEISTGSLHEQVVHDRAKAVKSVTDAKTVTTAQLLQLALTTFDNDGGTATVIGVVEIRSIPDGKQATTTRAGFAGQVRREGADGKVDAVQTLPVAK